MTIQPYIRTPGQRPITALPAPAAYPDALLDELGAARRRRDQADQEIRTLLALAREFTAPRPYPLTDLAQAAGMSPSGIRTAYGPAEISYLQLILTCNGKVPTYLRAPVLALRHQPSPTLPNRVDGIHT